MGQTLTTVTMAHFYSGSWPFFTPGLTLQLPLGKSVVLKGTGRAEAYQEAAEQAILGSDGYKTYQLAQDIVSALEGMGSGLVGKVGEFSDKAREIGSTIVDEVA